MTNQEAIAVLDAWAAQKKCRRYTLKHYPQGGYTFAEDAPSYWVLNVDDPSDPDSEREWGSPLGPDDARSRAAAALIADPAMAEEIEAMRAEGRM